MSSYFQPTFDEEERRAEQVLIACGDDPESWEVVRCVYWCDLPLKSFAVKTNPSYAFRAVYRNEEGELIAHEPGGATQKYAAVYTTTPYYLLRLRTRQSLIAIPFDE